MIAKVFQKLARVMERIRNYIEGLGFTSYEDLFAMIRRGEYARRDLSGIREFEREVMRSRAARLAQTETPEFRAWFGDSKVVDAEGKPLVVYHGTVVWERGGKTLGDITQFDRLHTEKVLGRKPSADQVGSWFSSNPDAQAGAGMYAGDGAIYPVYLAIANPRVLTFPQLRAAVEAAGGPEGFRAELSLAGHDGLRITPEYETGSTEFHGQDVFVALEPTQIKSAVGNIGAFDPNDPNIRYSKAATESITDITRRMNDGELQREQVNAHLADGSTRPICAISRSAWPRRRDSS